MTPRDADELTLRALTWNVEGLNESRLGQRMEKICLEILVGGDLAAAVAGAPTPPMPHVVALQEVVRVAHRGYFAPHFGAAGYTVWPENPPGDSEYYELLAVRPPWQLTQCERQPFDVSPLGRTCTRATIRHSGSERTVTVLTAHLESLRSGHEPRLAQVAQIDAWMRGAEGPAVFAGDTNLRDAEWDVVAPELALRDAFEEAGAPTRSRVTWRPPEGEGGFRFDRVWLAGPIRVRAFGLRHCPRSTDHEGVEVSLTLGCASPRRDGERGRT